MKNGQVPDRSKSSGMRIDLTRTVLETLGKFGRGDGETLVCQPVIGIGEAIVHQLV